MMNRQREQGVALLLALGVLSLLLVSGLAFVTNALLAQKSAAAYRFRSQSQLLGEICCKPDHDADALLSGSRR